MRYKHILLFTTLALLVHGCGSNSNNIELSDEQRLEKEAREYAEKQADYLHTYDSVINAFRPLTTAEKKSEIERIMKEYIAEKRENAKHHAAIKSDPRIQYIFNSTLEIDSPEFGTAGGSETYEGQISSHLKPLIKNIWINLQSKGFSGYNLEFFLNNTNGLLYKAEHRLPGSLFFFTPQSDIDFHFRVIDYLLCDLYQTRNLHYARELGYSSSLLGLKFNNKMLIPVIDNKKIEYVLDSTNRLSLSHYEMPFKISTDIPVTQEQLDEWNQIFVDALAQDPFFSQFFKPQTLSDATGSVSLLAARTGKIGLDAAHLTVNGVPGSHIDLGLPVFVQLKGSVDQGKSTNLTTGTVAYKLGNTLVGAIQTYSNSGTGFSVDSRHLESSVVASHSFDSFFIEGQLGSISATDVHFNDWSGSRAQFTVGIDTSWVSPFIQVSYRNLNNQSDTAVYGGLEIDLSEFKTDGYTVSTHLLTKAGYSNVKGTTGAVEWSGTLTLNSGLSFSTNLTLGTAAEPIAGLTFKLDR